MAQDPPTPWRKSKAKKLLQDDILSRRVLQFRGPAAVYYSRPEFQRYKKDNFCNNCRSLKKKCEARLAAATVAQDAVAHDLPRLQINRNRKNYFHYDGSDIQKQLRIDVQQGLTDGKRPLQVRKSRDVYKQANLSPNRFANLLSFERRRHEKKKNQKEYRDRITFLTAAINVDGEEDDQD